DILVGTQMIAKGHDFKNVTLVGILDADLSLYFADYRSNEKTFQLITQVAGRAGREQKSGRVIMQTYNPNHFVFRYASRYDYCGFFDKESNSRKVSKFPPYTKIVRILILSQAEADALKEARAMYLKIRDLKERTDDKIIRVQVMRAPIKKIQNRYRFQIVIWIKNEHEEEILPLIYKESETEEKGVTVFSEVNPQQMQ
ncbi:MAG: primosomal protein N', partial [Clostridia bacterium]